jgi:hypothetical protein
MTTVFISHSTRDSGFARTKLREFLERRGIGTWFSAVDTSPGADWEKRIRNALNNAEWYVVVVSPDAIQSDWVRAEVHWALEKRKGRVIPILVKDCDPSDLHLKLMQIQYLDFRKDAESAAAQLLQILESNQHPGDMQSNLDGSGDPTVVLSLPETHVRLVVVAGAQKGAQLSARFVRSCIIGRAENADLRIFDNLVSRRHAEIKVASRREGKYLIIDDLGSSNGTFVNQTRIVAPTPLQNEDKIDLGETRLVLKDLT